jgi:hypothetical protein
METAYMICFVAGATLLACQFLLSALGIGGHHDIGGDHEVGDLHDPGLHDTHAGGDHDHGAHHETVGTWFVSLLTFRTLVAAITFFGLAGLAASREWGAGMNSFLVAVGAGLAALFIVGYLMRSMSRLKAEGTVRMDRAVGKSGTVYLPIPARKGGIGKVMLNLQNRTVECQAVTAEQELLTGSKVVVVAVVSHDTVEVASAPI